MTDFSQPEKININELKRLLVEVIGDIIDHNTFYVKWSPEHEKLKRRLTRQIEQAILTGDDS